MHICDKWPQTSKHTHSRVQCSPTKCGVCSSSILISGSWVLLKFVLSLILLAQQRNPNAVGLPEVSATLLPWKAPPWGD